MIISCIISVGCLKQNGAVQHQEIEMMLNVYQILLANTSLNYNAFWVLLTSIWQEKTIHKNLLYKSNKMFSGVIPG